MSDDFWILLIILAVIMAFSNRNSEEKVTASYKRTAEIYNLKFIGA